MTNQLTPTLSARISTLCILVPEQALTTAHKEVNPCYEAAPVETLVRYHTDANGQLIQVTDRNGQPSRCFVYQPPALRQRPPTPDQPTGQISDFERDPRVVGRLSSCFWP